MSADLSRLKDILAKSKAVMKQTDVSLGSPMGETNGGSEGGYVSQQVTEHGEREMPNLTEQFAEKYGMTDGKIPSKSVSPKNGNYPNISKSKMPKAILDAMINNPIDIPENPFAANSFSLDDVPELMETPKPQRMVEQKQPKPKQTKSVTRESIKQIVREEFEDLVRDVLDEYMEKSLVTEDIHIKIGNTMFGGSLKPLPKKKKKIVR
jgi:hypothetical protein|tara:strand:- start:53 stop:676 length:624 start_codon:yes stop_codon:yes gene_type:complete